jgi:hypothetical protein
MTEAEWLSCNNPLGFLLRGKTSARKLRLFACACCRRVWDHLWSGNISQAAILTAERYADGLATAEELDASRRLVLSELELFPGEPVYDPSYWACETDLQDVVEGSAGYAANLSTRCIAEDVNDIDAQREKKRNGESDVQLTVLHDIVGPLPFRPILLHPACLVWNDSLIRKLALGIYDDRAFDLLPILADALEEAGCTDADILAHCRGPGPHVRGCWVVDLLLGKE